MAEALVELEARLKRLLGTLFDAMEGETAAVDAWLEEAERALVRYHQAAYMAGAGTTEIAPEAQRQIIRDARGQMEFLRGFAAEIREGREWEEGWRSRAEMYAAAIKVPYWRGATKMLPLPAMPGQGTQCLVYCKCSWDVEPLDEEAGDYDAYWRRGASDSCQTCVQREAEWSPLRIRGGMLA